jgi:hypothetical protein
MDSTMCVGWSSHFEVLWSVLQHLLMGHNSIHKGQPLTSQYPRPQSSCLPQILCVSPEDSEEPGIPWKALRAGCRPPTFLCLDSMSVCPGLHKARLQWGGLPVPGRTPAFEMERLGLYGSLKGNYGTCK